MTHLPNFVVSKMEGSKVCIDKSPLTDLVNE